MATHRRDSLRALGRPGSAASEARDRGDDSQGGEFRAFRFGNRHQQALAGDLDVDEFFSHPQTVIVEGEKVKLSAVMSSN